MHSCPTLPWFALFLFFSAHARGAEVVRTADYEQQKNIVFGETHGIGLVMDVFVPTKANGVAIVDVVSGSWSSSRGKLRDHERAQLFKIFCQHGYSVFAIRPGSVSKFTGLEMVDHIHQGIRWVKANGGDYGVTSSEFGIVGASAGGHLACLATVTSPDELRPSAVAAFFPPTDLLTFVGEDWDLEPTSDVSRAISAITFNGKLDGITRETMRERLVNLSPARLVTGKEPPFLLIHGDADRVVPLEQSRLMVKALQEKEVPAELIVKKDGGHPWFTIFQEVKVMATWFDGQLRKKKLPPE